MNKLKSRAEIIPRFNFLHLLIWIIICQSAGILGSIFTTPAITTWYVTLTKPAFTPPSFIFGPVWVILFTLMAISAYLIFQRGTKNIEVRDALIIFAVQLVFNILWSFFFFNQRNPLLGMVDILILLILIIAVTIEFWKINRIASMLLIPYLFWVLFAASLNFTIWQLNN